MGKHRPYPKRVKIGVSICLLAGGLIVGSAFMPWFDFGDGTGSSVGDVKLSGPVSGWELYELRASGEDGYGVDVSFADPADSNFQSTSVVFTGFAALISGLLLALSALFPLAMGLRQKRPVNVRLFRLAIRFLWVVWLVPAGLLGLAPSIGSIGFYLETRSMGAVAPGSGLIVLWAATLAGTAGVFIAGSGTGHFESWIPDVRRADWLQPYRLSGACPRRASGAMLATGVGGGVIVGFVGYWGGWLVQWVMLHLGEWVGLVGGVWLEAKGESSSGIGAKLALFVIAWMIIVSVAVMYPVILGVASGSSVARIATATKCRNTTVATLFGLLGGATTWGTLALTGLLAGGAVQESSRVLGLFEVVPGWLTSAVVAIDAALVILPAASVVRKSMKEVPFCERSQEWYGIRAETTVPFGTALPLVSALASGSAAGLSPLQTEHPAEILLSLRNCQCRLAESVLRADVTWPKVTRRGMVSIKRGRDSWFETTLPVELGAAVEEALFGSPEATGALTVEDATSEQEPSAMADPRMSEVGR